MRRGHPLAEGDLTLARYCSASHVLVSVSGRAYAEVDEALALRGGRRRVLATVCGGWFGVEAQAVLGRPWEPLPLFRA